MRRIALHAAVLATAAAIGCSSGGGGGGGDTTPPAAPVISAPADGATVDATKLVSGMVVFSGMAEVGATVELQVEGTRALSGTVVAAGGAWTYGATLPSGSYTVRARATDAAGNASAFSATVAFTVDTTRLATPLPAGSPLPVTSFGQTGADTAGLPEAFPGQANTWVVDRDFSLLQGFGLQYHSALVLFTGTPTDAARHPSLVDDVASGLLDAFPGDQAADDPVFLTPLFTPADGVLTATVSNGATVGVPPLSGTRSAFLNGTSDSRLSRTLSLAADRTYTLTWTDAVLLRAGALDGASQAPHAPYYRVVLRDAATGAQLGDPLYATATSTSGVHSETLPSGLPASVTLSFELRSAAAGFAEIDHVVLLDGSAEVALDEEFEGTTLDPWTTNAAAESQNVRSAPRVVGSGASTLSITRTFYAPPGASWGRLVDVFENTSATTVTTSAVYLTMLYPVAPHVEGARPSLVAWDPDQASRDVGIVAGNGAIVVQDGDPFAFTVHPLVVPPGDAIAIAHFVVQLGGAECATVPQQSCPTAEAAAAIAAGFPDDAQYAVDLEPGVLDLVQNF